MATDKTTSKDGFFFIKNTPADEKRRRIAVVSLGVKLGDETQGLARARFIADLLVAAGYEVDFITSRFQHWEKTHRSISNPCYKEHGFNIVFLEEPGYTKNLDVKRIRSHSIAAKNLCTYLDQTKGTYDLIYSQIPPNNIARVCAEFAASNDIPFVVDINDLWPEAMRMVFNAPLISDILYHGFSRDARIVYQLSSAVVGTSDEYTLRPSKDRAMDCPHITVYVGNDLSIFDAGVKKYRSDIKKPDGEIWVSYAGTVGASYDLATLIQASVLLSTGSNPDMPLIRIKILGDGPNRATLEQLANKLDAPVDFLGYMDFEHMAAYLDASDIVINSLVKSAAQSIVSKIGDYLASGKPIINTGSSIEFKEKVVNDGFGVNVEAEDPEALADVIMSLSTQKELRESMGKKGRVIAEKEFNQPESYKRIVDLVGSFIEGQHTQSLDGI